jgi:hypothetical protein
MAWMRWVAITHASGVRPAPEGAVKAPPAPAVVAPPQVSAQRAPAPADPGGDTLPAGAQTEWPFVVYRRLDDSSLVDSGNRPLHGPSCTTTKTSETIASRAFRVASKTSPPPAVHSVVRAVAAQSPCIIELHRPSQFWQPWNTGLHLGTSLVTSIIV